MNFLIIAVGILVVVDLVGVDLRYVNNDNFVSKRKMLEPFQETTADKIIAKDDGVFRVFDQTDGFDSAKTAYFHQSITGYHAAKPAGMQDLFNFHVYNGNLSVLNMMNINSKFEIVFRPWFTVLIFSSLDFMGTRETETNCIYI